MLCALLLTHPPAKAYENALFGYPHLLPSPYTLPAGTLIYGTQLAFGVTDFFQVGTNLLRDFYQIYNANGKISFFDSEDAAFALTVGYENYNLQSLDASNADVSVESWLPGGVLALGIVPELAWFLGGNLHFSEVKSSTEGVRSGVVQGATFQSDISWAYNPSRKRRGVGNVLSAGMSYDFTYSLLGLGISHHWPGFQLGVHYYVNADNRPLLPIIAGGGTAHF